jgi:hypothetical protein
MRAMFPEMDKKVQLGGLQERFIRLVEYTCPLYLILEICDGILKVVIVSSGMVDAIIQVRQVIRRSIREAG